MTIDESVKQQLAPGLYDENDVLLCSWEDSGLDNNCSDATDVVFRYSATKVVISSDATSIGYNAFGGCYNLKTVIIPDSVTYINSYAFRGCFSLTDVVIPDSVQSIGKDAFYDVPHIIYNGSAAGSPWGAKSVN